MRKYRNKHKEKIKPTKIMILKFIGKAKDLTKEINKEGE